MGSNPKRPWYPWYPGDFLADMADANFTLEEEGAYRRLLDHQWLHGSIPDEPELISKIIGSYRRDKSRRLWGKLKDKFPLSRGRGRWANAKLERVRDKQTASTTKLSEAGKAGAKVRWGDGDANAIAMPSPSQESCDRNGIPEPEPKLKTTTTTTGGAPKGAAPSSVPPVESLETDPPSLRAGGSSEEKINKLIQGVADHLEAPGPRLDL